MLDKKSHAFLAVGSNYFKVKILGNTLKAGSLNWYLHLLYEKYKSQKEKTLGEVEASQVFKQGMFENVRTLWIDDLSCDKSLTI